MVTKKTLERIKFSFFWEGLRADVKKFCESCKECQLTRSIRNKDRSPITPVARPELPFQVVNMDLIGPIDPTSSKGHKYILCLVDQHTSQLKRRFLIGRVDLDDGMGSDVRVGACRSKVLPSLVAWHLSGVMGGRREETWRSCQAGDGWCLAVVLLNWECRSESNGIG
ncbi:retrovirus-related Pol polyprotein from transposon opus [Trichonephila clavipes]|nr:retrovirus-related Pol polyprotein from transposon opus [Trichonephila clavipes]